VNNPQTRALIIQSIIDRREEANRRYLGQIFVPVMVDDDGRQMADREIAERVVEIGRDRYSRFIAVAD